MPQRSNWFQKLITVIEGLLAPEGAVVTESAMVMDRALGKPREVDILISAPVGIRTLIIGVECLGRKSRRADVTWVEAIASKHRHLPIDRTILVSRTGFTRNALTKAREFGMSTLSLSEALTSDWRTTLLSWPDTLKVTRPTVLEARVLLACEDEGDAALVHDSLAEATLYSSTGDVIGELRDVVRRAVDREEVQHEAQKHPVPGHEGVYAVRLELSDARQSFVVAPSQKRITFTSVRILAFLAYEVTEVAWVKGTYQGTPVAYARIPFGDGTVTMVATQPSGSEGKAQLFLERPAIRELSFQLELAESEGTPD